MKKELCTIITLLIILPFSQLFSIDQLVRKNDDDSYQKLSVSSINPAKSLPEEKLKYQPTGKQIYSRPQIVNHTFETSNDESNAALQLFFEREGMQRQSRTPVHLNSSLEKKLSGIDIQISADSTFVPAPNTQEKPAIASNGDIYLVVWHDWRNQFRGTFSDGDIYATRIDANGNILDPQGILVFNAPSNQLVPAVASDGQDFLVVWLDARNYISMKDEWDIYGAKITAGGTVINANGLLIEDKPDAIASAEYPPLRIAHSDSNYMIVWEQGGVILGHILDEVLIPKL